MGNAERRSRRSSGSAPLGNLYLIENIIIFDWKSNDAFLLGLSVQNV